MPNTLPIVCMGDFNVNTLQSLQGPATDFLNLMSSYGLNKMIDIVTRPDSSSCLDNIFINNSHHCANILVGLIDTLTPDHFPVFIAYNILNMNNLPDPPQTIQMFYGEK
jgi:hypothetical protein